MNPPHQPPNEITDIQAIPFWQALKFWWKLGWISFGGPAGQIALMHQELVENKRWISEKRFLHALNYCMLLPGPEAQQLATYIGWLMHKTMGGLVAGLLFILPSLFLIIGLSWVYIQFGDVPFIAGLFYGIKPAVTAIVFHATYRIAKRSLKNKTLWMIATLAFIAIFILKIPFPLIILSAAVVGFFLGRYYPQWLKNAPQHSTQSKDYGPAYIDDHTPTPEHAMFKWSRLFRVVLFGAIFWCTPITILTLSLGWEHHYTQMAWFFTKAALLTFGGAYAVLPYVYQGAVHHYGWLSANQMIDGLALGESTPGPLIMIVAYVGFLGGFSQAVLGSEHVFLAGLIGACIATWFTFLFSFVFILAGAPIIESMHQHIQFTTPLTAITAAVVGVILNLALFFAYHVLWPQGFSAELDVIALLLTLMATILLFYFEWNVMKVLFISAGFGLLVYLV